MRAFLPITAIMCTDSPPVPNLFTSNLLSKRANPPGTKGFEFDIDCGTKISTNDCEDAKRTINSVGALAASSLALREPINVRAEFKFLNDTCTIGIENRKLTCKQTPSNSSTVCQVARKSTGPFLRYPRAVLKQHMQQSPDSHDILLEFNEDAKWYFGRDEDEILVKNMFDLNLIAARELTRAMGFQSNLQIQQSNSGNSIYMAPKLITENGVTRFDDLNAFDNLLYLDTRASIFETVQKFLNLVTVPVETVPEAIDNDKPLQKAGYLVYSFASKIRASYQYRGRSTSVRVGLCARGEFGIVSMILDKRIGESAEINVLKNRISVYEYLMTNYTTFPGKLLSNDMILLKWNKLFGPKTLGILEEIGYPTDSSKPLVKFILKTNQQDSEKMPSKETTISEQSNVNAKDFKKFRDRNQEYKDDNPLH